MEKKEAQVLPLQLTFMSKESSPEGLFALHLPMKSIEQELQRADLEAHGCLGSRIPSEHWTFLGWTLSKAQSRGT